MLTEKKALLPSLDLSGVLGEEEEIDYRRLLRVLNVARGHFTLLPTESNFTFALRGAFFARLADDLKEMDLRLRVLTLTYDLWYLFDLSGLETPIEPDEVVIIVGLENTPRIVPEPGRKPERPPALNALNITRETIHKRIPVPLIVWCLPFVYDALMEHAPDFFDHYSALFHFNHVAAHYQIQLTEVPKVEFGDDITKLATIASSQVIVSFYERKLAETPEPTPERARYLIGLAEGLFGLQDEHRPENLQRAQSLAEEALEILSPENNEYDWARGQIVLGAILINSPLGDHIANVQRGLSCYNTALEVLTEERHPIHWARVHYNLGVIYRLLPFGDRTENLKKAIEHLEAALHIYNETDFSSFWAVAHILLGDAYAALDDDHKEQNLQCAISHYESALRVVTEQAYPHQWASLQCALGRIYIYLVTGSAPVEDQLNTYRAKSCFEAAQRVITIEEYPRDWANLQLGLSIVFRRLENSIDQLKP